MATSSELHRLVERYVAAYANGDISYLSEIIAPDFVDHTFPDFRGPAGVATAVGLVQTGFSELEITLLHCVAESDSVAFMVRAAGTHTGEFRGKLPSGNRVIWTLADFARVRDGKFAELWNVSDTLALLLGLGAQLV